MTDTEVKVNGVSAGPVHQGAFYQFRFNIGNLLTYGQANLLEVTVSKRSANSSINEAERAADYWIFGGIFRPVRLEARPTQSLQRVAVAARADGALSVVAHANNVSEPLAVHAWVENAQGQRVGDAFSGQIQAGEASRTLATQIPGVTPWTMEAPALYHLVTELRRGAETLHSLRECIGFRTVEVLPGDGLYLNGVKIRVKGINRHVFHPDHGRTSTRALSEETVRLIKELNMNAVRMSHYPPDQHMLEVCDEQGLLVIDELTGWQSPSYDTPTAQRLVREMVERDVNHPSIILWANGNEGGWNTAVDGDFALYDPQARTVIHPSTNFSGNIAQGGFDTTHYPKYSTLLDKLNGPNLYMPTEFLHGLYDGGHGAGLQDYWNAMRSSPRGVGGFLWVFADEGVRRTDQNGRIDNDGNHAADGIVGPYNEKKPSFNAVREIWSPVVLTPPAVTAQWNGAVQVLNDYYFTNLSQCTFRWELGNFSKVQDQGQTGLQVLVQGELAAPSVAPQSSGTLQIPLPVNWLNHDALRLTAINHEGKEVRQWTWPFRTQAETAAANIPAAPATAATATENPTSITLAGGPVQVTISKSTGRITGVAAHRQAVALTNGPRIVSGASTLTGITRSTAGNDQVVTASYSGNLNSMVYRLRGDGWMHISYTLNITGSQPNIGLTFDYPEGLVRGMRWLGGGPQPVWKNRLAGAMPGVWEKTANNPVPGQSYTTDPVFRGYHRDLRWASLKTSEARIQIVPETPDLFFRVLTPANGISPQNTQFTMPTGNVSLLHGISAIGNKFDTPSNIGSMSATNVGQGSYSGAFWMSFAETDLEVSSVHVATPYRIQVIFSQPMAPSALDPASYNIPGILIHGVKVGAGNSVWLDIQPLTADISYTLEIDPLTSATGRPLLGSRAFQISHQPRIELDLPFNTLAAGTSPDVSGKNRHAAVTNATLVASRRSKGLLFNGSSTSRATVPLPGMSGFTVEAWVRINNSTPSTFPRLISMANENIQIFFDYSGGASNGGVGVNVRGYADWRTPANVLPAFNTWFHVAVAYDSAATAPSIYLNGAPLAIASSNASPGTYGTAGDAVIGNRASDGLRGLNGIVDDFRIHSRPLAEAEINLSAEFPPTQSFDAWMAARGYPGSGETGDTDDNGVSDLLDYFSATPEGSSTGGLSVQPLVDNRLGFYFRIGKSIELVNWHLETSIALSNGTWSQVSKINIHPWRDLGAATEYLASPPDTSEPKLFGRLVVVRE